MNLNAAITLLLPTIIGASAVAISVADMLSTHQAASAKAAQVQNINDQQLLEAARLVYWLQDGGPRMLQKQI